MSAIFIGPTKCPNCDAHVGQRRSYCPFCHHSLSGAPWKRGWTVTGTIAAGAILLMWLSDQLFGTQIAETIRTLLAK